MTHFLAVGRDPVKAGAGRARAGERTTLSPNAAAAVAVISLKPKRYGRTMGLARRCPQMAAQEPSMLCGGWAHGVHGLVHERAVVWIATLAWRG
jgi:hypothetical protein